MAQTGGVTSDAAALQPLVADQYRRLGDLLEALPPASWERSSLCAGWRIREVIAHVSMPARYGAEEFMAKMRAYGFDFERLSNDIATEDAALPIETLVAGVRSEALASWAPPGGGYRGALNHAVIHGLDAATPLGLRGHVAPETMRVILDDLTEGGTHAHFGVDLRGRRLEATDLDWAHGDGESLTGPAEVLASHICGRDAVAGQAEGAPLARTASGSAG